MNFVRSFACISALALACASTTYGNEADLPTYVRFMVADPQFDDQRGDPLFSTLTIDRARDVASYGDVGELLLPCLDGYYCLSLMMITVAIPERCDQVGIGRAWRYGKRRFIVVDRITSLERKPENVRYVIEGFGEDGQRESLSVYSQERGLESFAVVDPAEGQRTLVHYYLSSERGALTEACIAVGKDK